MLISKTALSLLLAFLAISPDPAAPCWASLFRNCYRRTLEFIEWWVGNRQSADGSIGGGWGDDVELVPLWGWYSLISDDASPAIFEGTRRLVNGAYASDEIDPVAGFFAGLGDNEHTGEFTGDTQSMMVWVDYGNPLYFECCLKVAKLMRGGFNVAFTYRNTTRDFAAHVLGHTSRRAEILLYGFFDQPRKIAIRPRLLELGATYRLTWGTDRNHGRDPGRAIGESEFRLETLGQPVWFELPARTEVLVRIEQVRRDEVEKLRPDLAISAADIEIGPAQQLMATVHNIGSRAAGEFEVVFHDGDPTGTGREIGRHPVSHLDSPDGLVPQTLRVGMDFSKAEDRGYTVFVLVRPGKGAGEITLENNQASRRISRGEIVAMKARLRNSMEEILGAGKAKAPAR
jgi:hypothetical protein